MSEKKEAPRSAFLEELLKRNAEAEIYQYEKPRPHIVRFLLPEAERMDNPQDWFTGDVTVLISNEFRMKPAGYLDLVKAWSILCPFRSADETWALTCRWQYTRPFTAIVRCTSPESPDVLKTYELFQGFTSDLTATACRISDSPVPGTEKGRWIVPVTHGLRSVNSVYDSADVTVEFLDDWIRMDYDSVYTESPGDRDIRHERHFSRQIPVKYYTDREHLIRAVMFFLNEAEKDNKPSNPMSDAERLSLLEEKLFR